MRFVILFFNSVELHLRNLPAYIMIDNCHRLKIIYKKMQRGLITHTILNSITYTSDLKLVVSLLKKN